MSSLGKVKLQRADFPSDNESKGTQCSGPAEPGTNNGSCELPIFHGFAKFGGWEPLAGEVGGHLELSPGRQIGRKQRRGARFPRRRRHPRPRFSAFGGGHQAPTSFSSSTSLTSSLSRPRLATCDWYFLNFYSFGAGLDSSVSQHGAGGESGKSTAFVSGFEKRRFVQGSALFQKSLVSLRKTDNSEEAAQTAGRATAARALQRAETCSFVGRSSFDVSVGSGELEVLEEGRFFKSTDPRTR